MPFYLRPQTCACVGIAPVCLNHLTSGHTPTSVQRTSDFSCTIYSKWAVGTEREGRGKKEVGEKNREKGWGELSRALEIFRALEVDPTANLLPGSAKEFEKGQASHQERAFASAAPAE